MHQYLRAIGFRNALTCERDIELLLDNLYQTHEERVIAGSEEPGRAFWEMSKSFGPDIGIRMYGEMDGHGFHRTGYFPYLKATGVTTREPLSVEPKGNGSGYNGLVDDRRVGVSLIFTLQNPGRYLKEKFNGRFKGGTEAITLSALAQSGKILLPLGRVPSKVGQRPVEDFYRKHDALVNAAREGNQEAIESLTIEDMDTYAMISRRLASEDVYSIVETSFMPYGMECDQYQILGTILFYTKVRNFVTHESIYQMTISCNGMLFNVCINEEDLLGVPDEGRRFKGVVSLQGHVNF
ncbi:MAG: DUF3881 family protein [Lachnospiraceae bacterium]|nr:DUF3881 family protein [Lachnospiraceae bacterium]